MAASEIRTDVLQNGVARILLEAVMKLASLTESRLFVLVENHEGGRQFAGSRHLTQAFRQGGIAPHSTDTEVQIELATVRHQTTLPATSAPSASSNSGHAAAGIRRPAPREAVPGGGHGVGAASGVKRLKMADGTEQTVLDAQVGSAPAVASAALHSLHSPANVPYGQHFVTNNKASDWSSANLQTVQFEPVDEVTFQQQQHQSPQQHQQQQQQQHHDQRSLIDDTSDSCIPEELKKTWQEHRMALKERSPRQLARLERERRKRENMSDAEREVLRRKQALQARERRRNMSQALSLARRDQDVEYEIEERARLCGARYDPPVEGETLQEQRNRRANNRRRVKFAENKLDAVGLGNFEVKPIDVHEPSL